MVIKITISNGIMTRLRCFMLFLLLMILSACNSIVPAQSPPQLSYTPGAPINITNNQIDPGWFTLDYPDGWRVVTNIAIEPLRLTLVSPDEEMIIIIDTSCERPESTPEPGTYWRNGCQESDNYILGISGEPEIEFQAIYDPIFDAVISSIEFR